MKMLGFKKFVFLFWLTLIESIGISWSKFSFPEMIGGVAGVSEAGVNGNSGGIGAFFLLR